MAIDIVTADYLEEFLDVVQQELALVETACKREPEIYESSRISMVEEISSTLSSLLSPADQEDGESDEERQSEDE